MTYRVRRRAGKYRRIVVDHYLRTHAVCFGPDALSPDERRAIADQDPDLDAELETWISPDAEPDVRLAYSREPADRLEFIRQERRHLETVRAAGIRPAHPPLFAPPQS
jgi:hypothetical protein